MSSTKCKQCGLVNWSSASSCKRCGANLTDASSLTPTRPAIADDDYPQARFPHEAEGGVIKRCLHCGQELALKKWDSWNGFLVRCPHCGGLHGKRWNIRYVLLASLFFNALSFLFTMRLQKAFPTLVGFIVAAIIINYALDSEQIPDILEIIGAILLFLGPMLINAVVLIKHERDLDKSAPAK